MISNILFSRVFPFTVRPNYRLLPFVLTIATCRGPVIAPLLFFLSFSASFTPDQRHRGSFHFAKVHDFRDGRHRVESSSEPTPSRPDAIIPYFPFPGEMRRRLRGLGTGRAKGLFDAARPFTAQQVASDVSSPLGCIRVYSELSLPRGRSSTYIII